MTNRVVLLVLDLLPGVLHVPLPFSDPPLTCCGGLTVCRDRRPRPLSLQNMDADRPVMTTNLDAEDLAQPRALWASCCGVGPASQLDESSSERSKKSPKQATGPPPRPACGRAEMKGAASLRASPPLADGTKQLRPAPPPRSTGLGGPPGPESALGHQSSAQRPPWGWWAWWGWLEGVEQPVTGLYGLGGKYGEEGTWMGWPGHLG